MTQNGLQWDAEGVGKRIESFMKGALNSSIVRYAYQAGMWYYGESYITNVLQPGFALLEKKLSNKISFSIVITYALDSHHGARVRKISKVIYKKLDALLTN